MSVVVKIGKQEKEVIAARVESAANGFLALKAQIDALSEELEERKTILVEFANAQLKASDASTLAIGVANGAIKVEFGWDVKVENEAALRDLLGARFDDLVKTKITYTPEAKLKEMALIDDGLKETLLIKEKKPSVTAIRSK